MVIFGLSFIVMKHTNVQRHYTKDSFPSNPAWVLNKFTQFSEFLNFFLSRKTFIDILQEDPGH